MTHESSPAVAGQVERRVRPAAPATAEDRQIYDAIAENYRSGSVKVAYSAEEVRDMLRKKAEELGSQKALATACGVSAQFLSDIILGKREPSGKPLEFLGLRRAVRYEPNVHITGTGPVSLNNRTTQIQVSA